MDSKNVDSVIEENEAPRFKASITSLFLATYQKTTPAWAKLVSILGQFVILVGAIQASIWIWDLSTTNTYERNAKCIKAIADVRENSDVQRANSLRRNCGAMLASNFWQSQYGQNHPTAAERIGRDISKLQKETGNTSDTLADLLYLKALNEVFFDRDLAIETIENSISLKPDNPDAILLYAGLISNIREDQDLADSIIKNSNLNIDAEKRVSSFVLNTVIETGLEEIYNGTEEVQRKFIKDLIEVSKHDSSLFGQTSFLSTLIPLVYKLKDPKILEPIFTRTDNCQSYDHPTLRGFCLQGRYISAFVAKDYDQLGSLYNTAAKSFLQSDADALLSGLILTRYEFWDSEENRKLTPHLDLNTQEMVTILTDNLKRIDKAGDDVLTAHILLNLGNNLIGVRQQDQDQAYEYVNRAIALYDKQGAKLSLRLARDLNASRESRLGNSDSAYLSKIESFKNTAFDSLEEKGHLLQELSASARQAGLESNAMQHLNDALIAYESSAKQYTTFEGAWQNYRLHNLRGGANFSNVYVRRLDQLRQSSTDNLKFVISSLEEMSFFSIIYYGQGDPSLDEYMTNSIPETRRNFDAAMTELKSPSIPQDEYEFYESGLIQSYLNFSAWPQNNKDMAVSDWERWQQALLNAQTDKTNLSVDDTIERLASVDRFSSTDYSYEKALIQSTSRFMTWIQRRSIQRFKENHAKGIPTMPNPFENVDPEFLRRQLRIMVLTDKGISDYGVDTTSPMRGLEAARHINDLSLANEFAEMARLAFAEPSALRRDQSLYLTIFLHLQAIAYHYGQTCQSEAAYATLAEFKENWGDRFDVQYENAEDLYSRFKKIIKSGENKVRQDCQISD